MARRLLAIVLLALVPTGVAAQPHRGFIGPLAQSYTVRADQVDGTLPAAGVGGALTINPLLDVEVEIAKPIGTLQREYTGIGMSFAGPGASREEIEEMGVLTTFRHERSVASVLSFGAALHPRLGSSRVQPRAFVGVTTHFLSDATHLEFLRWPPTVSVEQLRRMQPDSGNRRAVGSLTLGAGAAIDLTAAVTLMPELRYDYGSIGDELNNVLRVGVRLVRRF